MIIFITGNKNKFSEVQAILGDKVEMHDIDLLEIQSLDPKEVVEAKLIEARKHIKTGTILVDDTGYNFNYFGRLPGVYSKHFLKELGLQKIYDILEKFGDNKATFYTYLGYMDENGNIEYFYGSTDGVIVSPRGENGFGYDPVFMPNGSEKTISELNDEERKIYKSRAKAVKLLKEFLDK